MPDSEEPEGLDDNGGQPAAPSEFRYDNVMDVSEESPPCSEPTWTDSDRDDIMESDSTAVFQ